MSERDQSIVDFTDQTPWEAVLDGIQEGSLVNPLSRTIQVMRGQENRLNSDYIRFLNTVIDVVLASPLLRGNEVVGFATLTAVTALSIHLERAWDQGQGVLVPLTSYVVEGITRIGLAYALNAGIDAVGQLSQTPAVRTGTEQIATPTPPPFVEVIPKEVPVATAPPLPTAISPDTLRAAAQTVVPPQTESSPIVQETSRFLQSFDLKSWLAGIATGAAGVVGLNRLRRRDRRDDDED